MAIASSAAAVTPASRERKRSFRLAFPEPSAPRMADAASSSTAAGTANATSPEAAVASAAAEPLAASAEPAAGAGLASGAGVGGDAADADAATATGLRGRFKWAWGWAGNAAEVAKEAVSVAGVVTASAVTGAVGGLLNREDKSNADAPAEAPQAAAPSEPEAAAPAQQERCSSATDPLLTQRWQTGSSSSSSAAAAATLPSTAMVSAAGAELPVPMEVEDVGRPAPATLGGEAGAGTAMEEGLSFAEVLLQPAQLPRLLAMTRNLQELSSRDEMRIAPLCRSEGIERVEVGSARMYLRRVLDSSGSIAGLEVLVAGSETDFSSRPESFVDCWLHTNASFRLVPLDESIWPNPGSARVHEGMQAAYMRASSEFRAKLQDLMPSPAATDGSHGQRQPVVTLLGYSLGGALATLACVDILSRYPAEMELVTFGTPRVGNADFVRLLDGCKGSGRKLELARFVNAMDPVPHVPCNAADNDDDQVWANLEASLAAAQNSVIGTDEGGPYCHITKSTKLDALASSCGGTIARLTTALAASTSLTSTSLRVPQEFFQHHQFRTYIANLHGAAKPAWFAVASGLLGCSGEVVQAASAAASLLPVVASKVAAALPSAAGAAAATSGGTAVAAASGTAAAGAGAAATAGTAALTAGGGAAATAALTLAEAAPAAATMATGSAAAAAGAGLTATTAGAIVIPQVLGTAASAYGAYVICRRVDRLSQEVRTGGQQLGQAIGYVASDIACLRSEISEVGRHFEQRLSDLGKLLAQQKADDLVIRVRAARRCLEQEIFVLVNRPTEQQCSIVRSSARGLRQTATELQELATTWQSRDSTRLQGVELAQLWGLVLEGSHLALLASAITDEEDSAVRATQALEQLAPDLGRFYWLYMRSGRERWLQDLSTERERFLGLTISLAASRQDMLQNLREAAPTRFLFGVLALTPDSVDVRANLAMALSREDPRRSAPLPISNGDVEEILGEPMPARSLLFVRALQAKEEADAIGSSEAQADAARTNFLAGVVHLMPHDGQPSDMGVVVQLWGWAAKQGANLVPAFRALHDKGAVAPQVWEAIGSATELLGTEGVALASQLFSAAILPETAAAKMRAWLRTKTSVDDLVRAQAIQAHDSQEALQLMARALQNDRDSVEELLNRTSEVCSDLIEVIQVATHDLGEKEQQDVTEVKDRLANDLKMLNEETRYLVFGGLVSAGKTTLVNALLQHLVPELRKEVKEDKKGRLNLMPTAFNENTRIVTEVELSPVATEIDVQLLEKSAPTLARGRSNPPAVPDTVDDASALTPRRITSASSSGAAGGRGGGLEEGFVEKQAFTIPLKKGWRKLQGKIQDICQEEPPDDAMRRLCIRVPCKYVEKAVSIIDTPGLDSPSVWQQLRALVHAKAFLFIWVGSLDAANAFGLQGRRLVDMYRSTGQPLPPTLVLTKWDRLKDLPEFRDDPEMLAEQVRSRLTQYKSGLLPPEKVMTAAHLTQKSEVEQIIASLAVEWAESKSPAAGSSASAASAEASATERWVLTRSVAVGGTTLYKGSVLVAEQAEDVPANPEQYLRSRTLPFRLSFRTEEAEALLLLAATNASAALEHKASSAQEQASKDLGSLWQSLLPLLNGLSEPLRISKRLHKIIVATQSVINILLKDDQQAMIFEQNREELESLQKKVLQSFESKLNQYFAGLPQIVEPPDFVPQGCVPQESLMSYRPPAGLKREECATCLIPQFILEAHTAAQQEKSQFKYVKAVATSAIERWQQKFIENMMRLQQECTLELQQQVSSIMQIHGLIDHAGWQTNLQSLIASPVESVLTGMVAGSVVGVYGGLVAEAVGATLLPGIGVAVGIGLGVLIAGATAAAFFNQSDLSRHLGMWSHEDGQSRAAQTVLDVINKPDFQAKAKGMIMSEFERRLQVCMDQLADLRDPSNTNQPEARKALSIQIRVAELQRTLSNWFSQFISDQVGRDPWLVQPPSDLRAAMDGDKQALSTILGVVPADDGGDAPSDVEELSSDEEEGGS